MRPDCIVRVMERPLLLLIQGLLLAIPTVSVILAISPVSHVDFPIVLLLLHGPPATRLKKSRPNFRSLNACVSYCEQISHRLGLLHGDLPHGLDVADSIAEGVDDLEVIDVWDSVSGVAEMFHVVPKALIMLLSDGL
jgi:hypothetical protein